MSKSLSIDKPLDSNFKPIKDSDGNISPIEITEDKIKVKDLKVIGTTELLKGGTVVGSMYFVEDSASSDDVAGYGQVWAKNEDPNQLYYTNDDGNDIQITHKDHLAPTEQIRLQVRNDEGSTIAAGSPLYSKGEIGGSERILVGVCDADDTSKMPCIGIAFEEMNTSSTKDNYAVVSGVYNTNISGFTGLSVGDTLYVSDSGGLTKTRPEGEDDLVQNIGIVLRTNGTICQGLLVSAIGRTNDIPNDAYAGRVLGATRIANNGTGSLDNIINLTSTMTVLQTYQGTDVSIAFTAPPSGNVFIEFRCRLFTSSTTVAFALSDNATFNEIDETHTYDGGVYRMDETDTNTISIGWLVTGLTSGTSYTYYVGGEETSGSSASINHGRFRSTGTHYPPIMVTATAMPATITTGE